MQQSTDAQDKRDPSIEFAPVVQSTTAQVEAAEKLTAIITDPNLSEADKKADAWQVLNSLNP